MNLEIPVIKTKETTPSETLDNKNTQNKDIQKEFHQLLSQKKETEALQFLLTNYENNPNYANKHALEISAGMNEQIKDLIFQHSADQLRAELYIQYKQLSERQKTKRGFKDFLQEYVNEIKSKEEGLVNDDQKFFDELLKHSERYTYFDDLGGEPGQFRTGRENYKEIKEKTLSQLNESIKKLDLIKEIVQKGRVEENI